MSCCLSSRLILLDLLLAKGGRLKKLEVKYRKTSCSASTCLKVCPNCQKMEGRNSVNKRLITFSTQQCKYLIFKADFIRISKLLPEIDMKFKKFNSSVDICELYGYHRPQSYFHSHYNMSTEQDLLWKYSHRWKLFSNFWVSLVEGTHDVLAYSTSNNIYFLINDVRSMTLNLCQHDTLSFLRLLDGVRGIKWRQWPSRKLWIFFSSNRNTVSDVLLAAVYYFFKSWKLLFNKKISNTNCIIFRFSACLNLKIPKCVKN